MFKRFFANKHLGHWIRIGAEYAALLLLFSHLLPPALLQNWRTNGLAAIVLLGAALILSLWHRYRAETDQKKILNEKNRELLSKDEEVDSLRRLTTYADVFPLLNEGFSKLHDTIRNQPGEPQFREAFKDFCTKLSHVFTTVSGSKCHVCIKIAIQRRGNKKISSMKARTLVRDALSVQRDAPDSNNIEHLFVQNTDFEFIYKNISSAKGRYYFNNNLPAVSDYKNTSFLAKGDSPTYFHAGTSVEEKERNWPLPYRASITVPVCPGISEQRNIGTLVGFLCVDSAKANVFNENVDPELVFGCADGLYNPLRTYIETFLVNR